MVCRLKQTAWCCCVLVCMIVACIRHMLWCDLSWIEHPCQQVLHKASMWAEVLLQAVVLDWSDVSSLCIWTLCQNIATLVLQNQPFADDSIFVSVMHLSFKQLSTLAQNYRRPLDCPSHPAVNYSLRSNSSMQMFLVVLKFPLWQYCCWNIMPLSQSVLRSSLFDLSSSVVSRCSVVPFIACCSGVKNHHEPENRGFSASNSTE